MDIRRRGFTLIELLVVVSIVTVLAAILFPVFAAARNKSRQVRCAANMRELGRAVLLYTADSGGFVPPASTFRPGGHFPADDYGCPMDVVWWDAVMSYVRTDSVYFCPSVGPPVPLYYINTKLSFPTPCYLDRCTRLSDTVLLVEWGASHDPRTSGYVPCMAEIRDYNTSALHHDGRMNVCFADGHVKLTGQPDLAGGSPLWEIRK